MAYLLEYAPAALNDLRRLEAYIATVSYARTAADFVERIRARCERLCLAPLHGRNLDDVKTGFRSVGFESCASIGYEITAGTVRILAISYRGRRLTGRLRF